MIRRLMLRAVLFAFFWWMLTQGDGQSWTVGIPAVLAAALTSLALAPAPGWSWTLSGILRFVPFFLWHSLVAGVQVAGQALSPSLALAPQVVPYRLRLPAGAARVFFVNATSLQPGTVSAQLTEDYLTLHVLVGGQAMAKKLCALESAVARLFGVALSTQGTIQEEASGG